MVCNIQGWACSKSELILGNPFFQEAENLVAEVIPKHLVEAAPEAAVYLKESVGNSTRIDYGTGTIS